MRWIALITLWTVNNVTVKYPLERSQGVFKAVLGISHLEIPRKDPSGSFQGGLYLWHHWQSIFYTFVAKVYCLDCKQCQGTIFLFNQEILAIVVANVLTAKWNLNAFMGRRTLFSVQAVHIKVHYAMKLFGSTTICMLTILHAKCRAALSFLII